MSCVNLSKILINIILLFFIMLIDQFNLSCAQVLLIVCASLLVISLIIVYATGFKNPFKAVNYKKSAKDAYIYGQSLILMEATRAFLSNVTKPGHGIEAPMNQFTGTSQLMTAKFKTIVAPNVDTAYSASWLDLSAEPMVIVFPNAEERYWVAAFQDHWQDPYHTLAGIKGNFGEHIVVVASPNANKSAIKTTLPIIQSPTNNSLLLVRYLSHRTENDMQEINALQEKLKVIPLSKYNEYGQNYTPPEGKINPDINMKVSPPDRVETMTAKEFFDMFISTLEGNIPHKIRDAAYLENLKLMGFEAGKKIDWSKFTDKQIEEMQEGIDEARAEINEIASNSDKQGKVVNGWVSSLELFHYDYNTRNIKRDMIGIKGFGALPTTESIYFVGNTDSEGKKLSSENDYEIRFKKGEYPPVQAFWSVTLYDKDGWLVDNELDRYNISNQDKLTPEENGDMVVYISTNPANVKSNWLPSGENTGEFELALRCYAPNSELYSGKWKPPVVQKVSKANA